MTDRYRYPVAGRSATFNPARVSLAGNLANYGSVYAAGNEPEFVASPTRYATAVPRGYHTPAAPSNGSTAGPPRAYTLNQESRPPSRPSNREPSRNRRSTLDTATARPPIIVTTMQDHHPHNPASHSSAAASHSANTSAHNASPVREPPYRSSDGKLYTQPASSIRTRSSNRPYHASMSTDDYPSRPRERGERGELVLANRDADNYRSSRPSVLYPSDPRHSNAAIDYGDDGYQYTNAGELVKYDLDHATPPPANFRSRRHERHESFDRGYHRPNINYNADQRSFNVNTSHDQPRHYSGSSRPYDNRGGPPPSTRGFDKINRAYDNVPPAVPVPPAPASGAQSDSSTGTLVRREGRCPRPVSLNQEIGSRVPHPDEYYRGHVPDDGYDRPRFYDDSVTARGFGIRVNPFNEPEERQSRYWDSKRDEARDDLGRDDQKRERVPRQDGQRGSDEENGRESDVDRDDWIRPHKDEGRDRPEARRSSDVESENRPNPSLRDKITAGLGVAASAVGLGLGSSAKKDEKKKSPFVEDAGPARQQSLDGPRDQRRDSDAHSRSTTQEDEREPERNGDMARKSEAELRERHRREAEAKLNGEAVVSASDSDESSARAPSIRHRASSVFDPNDAGKHAPAPLKEQDVVGSPDPEDKEMDGEKQDQERSPTPENRVRSASPPADDKDAEAEPGDESRSRDLVVHSEAKQVRVVSPPREKKEGKPLKGILKQPSAKFPEDRNPIREGVAPHKDDKKLKEVPPGAKWTKINRKIVNPEALEVGKERYEVRDDFVIVLRVLSKEEIEAYARATQVLRERRRNKEHVDRGRNYERGYEEHEEQYEEDRGRHNSHYHRRHRGDEGGGGHDEWNEDRERDRRRRSRREDEEYNSRTRDPEHRHYRRERA